MGFLALLLVALALSAATAEYDLYLFDQSTGALCLDGSSAGFYLSRSPSGSSSGWILFLEGGGWCRNESDCVERSLKSSLGSSKDWKQTMAEGEGLTSRDENVNPITCDWNMVYVKYCDAGSYSGYRAEAVNVVVNDSQHDIFFRGRTILEVLTSTLMDMGMDSANTVILGGSSAGGLGVFMHLDWFSSQFDSTTTRVLGVADSGFFMNLPSWDNSFTFTDAFKYIWNMQNATFGNDACAAFYSSEEQWKCFMSPYFVSFIKTPMFVMNSLADKYQMENILNISPCIEADSCSAGECSALANFRDEMIAQLESVLESSVHGAWLPSTFTHTGVFSNHLWEEVEVQNVTMKETIQMWFNQDPGFQSVVDGPFHGTNGSLCTASFTT